MDDTQIKSNKNSIPNLLILIAVLFIIFGVKNEIYAVFKYYTTYNTDVKRDCKDFDLQYKTYKSNKGSIYNKLSFFTKNEELIDLVDNKILYSYSSSKTAFETCIEYKSDIFIAWITNAPLISKPGSKYFIRKSGILDHYKFKIAINLIGGLISFSIFFNIILKIKKYSEGHFRIAILLSLVVASIPYLIAPVGEMATQQTQSITYPATILSFLYFFYRIYKWISDGFKKNQNIK
jgi:hypothetical protein